MLFRSFDAALVKEQGITFAIVVVSPSVFSGNSEKLSSTINFFSDFFGNGIPIILMFQDKKGIPTYYGRNDIVNFLSEIELERISFKRYTY